jgi:hypothetical protein
MREAGRPSAPESPFVELCRELETSLPANVTGPETSASGPVRSMVRPYGTAVMRFWGPGATGEKAVK